MNVSKSDKKIVLELTQFCNLKCEHCLYNDFEKNGENFLSKEKAFLLIEKANAGSINKLVFTGGEPTIHPYFLEIAQYAIANIPKVSICTNGYFPSEILENQVLELNFSTYTVSIDSNIEKIHDNFRGKRGAFKKNC